MIEHAIARVDGRTVKFALLIAWRDQAAQAKLTEADFIAAMIRRWWGDGVEIANIEIVRGEHD